MMNNNKNKEIDWSLTHPIVKDKVVDQSEEYGKLLQDIANYKPKESYLDMRAQGKLRNSVKNDSVVQIIQTIKKSENKLNDKKEKMIKSEEIIQETVDAQEAQKRNMFSGDYEIIDELDKSKNVKRSKMTDFKSKYFIPYGPDANKKTELEDVGKISSEDINSAILAEDYSDMLQQRKKYVWDKQKKRFVIGRTDEKGNILKDKEDRKTKKEVGKNTLKKWERVNQLQRQKDGEVEDQSMTNRAKELFQNRNRRGKGGKIFHQTPQKNSEVSYQKGGKSELKDPRQMMKNKKAQLNIKLKNMEKGKRRQIENRQRIAKNSRGIKKPKDGRGIGQRTGKIIKFGKGGGRGNSKGKR